MKTSDNFLDALHKICNKTVNEEALPEDWTKSIIIPLFKKGNLHDCNNYCTSRHSLISYPSKVLLKVILNKISPPIESILREEQAGFRKNKSTVGPGNIIILCKKYTDYQN